MMNKIIALIVVLAIIWAIPAARTQLSASALPILEKLGPRGEALIQPARREAAKKQINAILRVLASELDTGQPLPDARGFQPWMKRRIPELTGLDPWGNPYWLETRREEPPAVGSSGPDGERDTADDIRQTARF
jgi:hypothetical protein